MLTDLIVTFVGDDRQGIVQELSQRVTQNGGNWLESRMSRMAGKFAGIARIAIEPSHVERLSKELMAIDGLSTLLEPAKGSDEDLSMLAFSMSIIGPDRPGIMSEITAALLKKQVNLAEVDTRVGPAPMSGEHTFFAEVNILVPPEVSMAALETTLNQVADDLAVDIRFE